MEAWREAVIKEAKTWYGTPYVPKARVKGVGTDCGGLLYACYNPIFGPFASMPSDYPQDWAAHSSRERYLEFIEPYVHQVNEPQPGDFSVFHQGNAYSHAAILLDNGKYIHAWGRLRDGMVTLSPVRVMNYMGRDFPIKHFTPNG